MYVVLNENELLNSSLYILQSSPSLSSMSVDPETYATYWRNRHLYGSCTTYKGYTVSKRMLYLIQCEAQLELWTDLSVGNLC